jgi:hypothetical protein
LRIHGSMKLGTSVPDALLKADQRSFVVAFPAYIRVRAS